MSSTFSGIDFVPIFNQNHTVTRNAIYFMFKQ